MIGSCTLLVKKGNVYDAHVVGMLSLQLGMTNGVAKIIAEEKRRKPKVITFGQMIAKALPKWERQGAESKGLTQAEHDAIHLATSTNPGTKGYHELAGDGTYTYDPGTKRLYQPMCDLTAWPYPKVMPLTMEDVTEKTE